MRFLLSILISIFLNACGDSVSKGGGTEVEGVIYATLSNAEDSIDGVESISLFRYNQSQWILDSSFSESGSLLKLTVDSDWFTLSVEEGEASSFYGPFHPSWNRQSQPISLVLRQKITICLPLLEKGSWALFSPKVENWTSNKDWSCLSDVIQGNRVLEKKEENQIGVVGLNLHTYKDTVYLPGLGLSDFYIPSFIHSARGLRLPDIPVDQIDYNWVDLVKDVAEPSVLKSFWVLYDSNTFTGVDGEGEAFADVQKLVQGLTDSLNQVLDINFVSSAIGISNVEEQVLLEKGTTSYVVYLFSGDVKGINTNLGVPVLPIKIDQLKDSALIDSFIQDWAVLEGAPNYELFIPDDSLWKKLIPENVYQSESIVIWDEWSKALLEARRNVETPLLPSWMVLWLDINFELSDYEGEELQMTKFDIKKGEWTNPEALENNFFNLSPIDFIDGEYNIFGVVRIFSNSKDWIIPYWVFSLAQYEEDKNKTHKVPSQANLK